MSWILLIRRSSKPGLWPDTESRLILFGPNALIFSFCSSFRSFMCSSASCFISLNFGIDSKILVRIFIIFRYYWEEKWLVTAWDFQATSPIKICTMNNMTDSFPAGKNNTSFVKIPRFKCGVLSLDSRPSGYQRDVSAMNLKSFCNIWTFYWDNGFKTLTIVLDFFHELVSGLCWTEAR